MNPPVPEVIQAARTRIIINNLKLCGQRGELEASSAFCLFATIADCDYFQTLAVSHDEKIYIFFTRLILLIALVKENDFN